MCFPGDGSLAFKARQHIPWSSYLFILTIIFYNIKPLQNFPVLEIAGRQVAKCDQNHSGRPHLVRNTCICRPKNYVWATNSESMHAL